MANINKWIAGEQAYSSGNLADNTALASRASGYYAICQVSAADVVIDNATNKDKFLTIEALFGSWTPTVNDLVEFYLLYAPDGTNYESGSATFLPTLDRLWRYRRLSTDTTAAAKRVIVHGPILPFAFKVLWRWRGTNATAASGNAFSWQTHNDNLNG